MSNMQAVNELMGKYDDQAIKQAILEAYALGRDDGIEETKGKVYKAVGRYLGIEPVTVTFTGEGIHGATITTYEWPFNASSNESEGDMGKAANQ